MWGSKVTVRADTGVTLLEFATLWEERDNLHVYMYTLYTHVHVHACTLYMFTCALYMFTCALYTCTVYSNASLAVSRLFWGVQALYLLPCLTRYMMIRQSPKSGGVEPGPTWGQTAERKEER